MKEQYATNKVQSLINELGKSKKTIADLKKELDDLRKDNKRLKKNQFDNYAHYLRNKDLLEVNVKCKEKIKQLEIENEILHIEKEELKENLQELSIANNGLTDENKEVIDDNETLIKDNEELKEEINFITSNCAPKDMMNDLEKEVKELKKLLEIKEMTINRYERIRLESIQSIKCSQHDIKFIEGEEDRILAHVKILEGANQKYFQENINLNRENRKLQNENNKLKDILEMNNKSLKRCNEAIAKYLGKE